MAIRGQMTAIRIETDTGVGYRKSWTSPTLSMHCSKPGSGHLEKNDKADAADLGDELGKPGFVVGDEDGRQYWRHALPCK